MTKGVVVDFTEILKDFPHKGFCQDANGQWCSVGRGECIPLGLYGNQSIADLRTKVKEFRRGTSKQRNAGNTD